MSGPQLPERPQPPIGELRWSWYFAAWIVVVDYLEDDDWRFVIVDRPHLGVLTAQTRLSEMPTEPER
jgi:hypothetical protein